MTPAVPFEAGGDASLTVCSGWSVLTGLVAAAGKEPGRSVVVQVVGRDEECSSLQTRAVRLDRVEAKAPPPRTFVTERTWSLQGKDTPRGRGHYPAEGRIYLSRFLAALTGSLSVFREIDHEFRRSHSQ